MTILAEILGRPRNAAIVLILASLGALATAFTSQYVFGLAPCKLCIYQRWPYGIVMALALLGWCLPRFLLLLLFCGVALFAGTVVAVYHVGVEQAWWLGPSGCSANIGGAKTVAELRRQLMATAPVRCDQVAWSLFGISFAGYNAIASFVLAVFAAGSGWRGWRTA